MKKNESAFTLIELLVSLTIIATLAALSLAGIEKVKGAAQKAACAHSLRQLGAATILYLGDHKQCFFPYVTVSPEGPIWYFGLDTGGPEGERNLDGTKAPLYPYLQQVGGVEICPAFPYNDALWKPKFKGASWGYGYNYALGGGAMGTLPPKSLLDLPQPSRVIVFGDCAQVNVFQAPASPKHPMLEEFYMIDSQFKTIHFRHGATANMLFADGHIEAMPLCPGTQDMRITSEIVGRISPVGSMMFLQ